MKTVIAVLLLLLTVPASFAAKPRDWKDAKLTRISTNDTGSAAVIPIAGGLYGAKIYQTNYVFETPDLVIIGATRNKKPLNVTVNKTTKIATEKNNLYIIDDDGKEVKIQITGKRAK